MVAPIFPDKTDILALTRRHTLKPHRRIEAKGDGGWISTAPAVANAWFATRNAELGYNVAPLVRLAKKWNVSHSTRMQSFHLETIAATAFSKLGSSRQNGLASFFEWAPKHLDVTDPGQQSGSLSSYLSWGARTELLTALGSASDRAKKALAAEAGGGHTEAKRLWGIILGSGFPT